MRKFKYATVSRTMDLGYHATISDAENLVDHNTAVFADLVGNINLLPDDIYDISVLIYSGFETWEELEKFCKERDYTIV